MKPKLLLCLALVLSGDLLDRFNPAFAGESAMETNSIYRNEDLGFELVVPKEWTATETNFEVFHYNDVFLTVNSRRPDLAITKQRVGPGEYEFGPKVILQQLPPGEAYLAIGYFDGPGGPLMQMDSVGKNLHELLTSNSIPPSSDTGLAKMDLRFFKRGHWWSVSVYLREPISSGDRKKVVALLRSFHFMDSPVGNVTWAESLAWKELPEKIRLPEKWPKWPVVDYAGQRPQYGPRSLVVKKTDGGYSVVFTVKDVGTWEYSVSTNGRVVLFRAF